MVPTQLVANKSRMESRYTQEQLKDIEQKASESSSVRLLYEAIQWGLRRNETAMRILLDELHNRSSAGERFLVLRLYILGCLLINFRSTFNKRWYVFHEDEREVRGQLRLAIGTHLFTLTVLLAIAFASMFLIGLRSWYWVLVVVPVLYLIDSAYYAHQIVHPIKEDMKLRRKQR
jgi:hypothetical protein